MSLKILKMMTILDSRRFLALLLLVPQLCVVVVVVAKLCVVEGLLLQVQIWTDSFILSENVAEVVC